MGAPFQDSIAGLEATVDNASEDEDDVNEEDSFIQDDNKDDDDEPVALDRTRSHHLLCLKTPVRKRMVGIPCLIVRVPEGALMIRICHSHIHLVICLLLLVHVVEPKDGPPWLKESVSYLRSSPSWLRLTKYAYRGDLAFVKDYSDGADVIVVPRIDFRRRKSTIGKRTHTSSPPRSGKASTARHQQALFDADKVIEIWGHKSVETRNQAFVFKGKLFLDGHLCLETDDFHPDAAIPSIDEIALFSHSKSIPKEFIAHTLEIMAARRLCSGDPVRIVTGQAQGASGTVESVIDEEAVVRLSSVNMQLTLPVDALRKKVTIGDEVVVAAGPHGHLYGRYYPSWDTFSSSASSDLSLSPFQRFGSRVGAEGDAGRDDFIEEGTLGAWGRWGVVFEVIPSPIHWIHWDLRGSRWCSGEKGVGAAHSPGQQLSMENVNPALTKCNEYCNRYLCLKMEDFYPEAAIPTPDELRFFEHHIPDDFLRSTLEIMGVRRLLLGQPVKVADGQAQGAVGIVESIVGDEAIVHISSYYPRQNYLKFLEVNPRTFAFPSENPPPPFPKARPKRKPPDQPARNRNGCEVHHCRLAHRMQPDEGLHNQPACPEDLVWVPELFRLLRRDEAIAAGLIFADQQQGVGLLD
ncbi:hypothetical protein D9615_004193 [Tricholomella constricta]|uniref:KOW domain-containing protein n=1 Tax=Tricholomella constricta TaxID=117010 RepID=A0A8H5HF55_9AGAR|nr:hypothetical protein D9615_004193 [Tricholomella constricta]